MKEKGNSMSTLLHIDSSVDNRNSVSRKLTAGFVDGWLKENPEYRVKYRNLSVNPVPGVTGDLLETLFSPPGTEHSEGKKATLAAADGIIEEFLSADLYVFGVPMYNFSVPAAFKSYMDQIVRVGRTMARGPKGLEGLVKGKKLLIVSTRSGDYSQGGPRDGWDFHEPYLRKFFGWLGIEDITYIPVIHNPAHGDAEAQARRIELVETQLQDTAARWMARSESTARLTADQASA
jgi:FMN-dependent NADH-azoreductase